MAIGTHWRFQLGGVPPPGDNVRVGVLRAPARPEQVVDQPGDSFPARTDLPDHCRILFRTSSAAWSRSRARRMLSAAYGRRSPLRWPVALSFATAWLRLTPMRRTSPAARMNSPSASRSGDSPTTAPLRAADKTTCAAYAPLASPARSAAAPTSIEFLIAEIEPHRPRPLHGLAGSPSRPYARRCQTVLLAIHDPCIASSPDALLRALPFIGLPPVLPEFARGWLL